MKKIAKYDQYMGWFSLEGTSQDLIDQIIQRCDLEDTMETHSVEGITEHVVSIDDVWYYIFTCYSVEWGFVKIVESQNELLEIKRRFSKTYVKPNTPDEWIRAYEKMYVEERVPFREN